MKVNTFLLFHYYLPWKRVGPFIWRHLNPLYPRMLCAKFGWNWSGGSWEEDFKFQILKRIFSYYAIIPLVLVHSEPFICFTTLVCFVWSFIEIDRVKKKIKADFWKSIHFYYFSIISPSVMVWPLNHFVCQVWLPIDFILAQWPVLEKKNFKYCQFIFAISLLFPLGNGRGPSFEQTWTPFTRGCFVPSLVEIGLVVLEKKMKM